MFSYDDIKSDIEQLIQKSNVAQKTANTVFLDLCIFDKFIRNRYNTIVNPFLHFDHAYSKVDELICLLLDVKSALGSLDSLFGSDSVKGVSND